MTDRDLRKLGRNDLLELLLEQTKEIDRLRIELDTTKKQLADRKIMLDNAGSIAEASLMLNGVFAAAQDACAQYMENIQDLSQRQEEICAQMQKETKLKCDMMIANAKTEADAYWNNINKKVDELFDSYTGLRDFLAVNAALRKRQY